ncbi:hypothetical protein ACXZ1K_09590 [Pedobacter sp. PWIIR3]
MVTQDRSSPTDKRGTKTELMKKLSLKLGGIKEMLTREQMKKITGGYGSGPAGNCTITCSDGVVHQACACHTGERHKYCGCSGQLGSGICSFGSDCDTTTDNTPWCGPYYC